MIVELSPVNNRKSFYGKAIMRTTKDETRELYSYNTLVCKIKNGKFQRVWGGYSATTMNHINAFLVANGKEKQNKTWWVKQPILNKTKTEWK